jgi:hypothetical protein
VQGAVDVAASADTVSVAPGTYVGSVFVDKRLTIAGAGVGTTVLRPSFGAVSVVDADGDTANRGMVSHRGQHDQ